MNIFDRIVSAVSPERALKRAQARAKASAISMAYDGATKGRRAQGWRIASTDANAENGPALIRLRDVARDMVRNNPHASRGKNAISNNVIGPGIFPSVVAKKEKDRARLEDLIKRHLDTPACDVNGQLDLYGIQALAMSTIVESGEALVRVRFRRTEDGLALPWQLEVLEPDFLDTSKDGILKNGGWIIQGIEFSPIGQRVGYWLFDTHPGSTVSWRSNTVSRFVPSQNVAHIYRIDRPGQVRGVTWFAPVILKMRDLADYSDAQLVRQKVAACFAAFIHSDEDISGVLTDNGDDFQVESLEPGLIQRLRPGEDVTFGSPPEVGEYEAYKRAELRDIAVGLGMSYEALSGDLSNVNFSSGRMGWLEFQRTIKHAQNQMMIPQLCGPIGRWIIEGARLATGQNVEASITWTPSPREMINPAEEVRGAKDAIRSGLSSRSNEQRKLGYDPIELDAEISADNERADTLGLILDSDPRKVTSVGNAAGLTDIPQGEQNGRTGR